MFHKSDHIIMLPTNIVTHVVAGGVLRVRGVTLVMIMFQGMMFRVLGTKLCVLNMEVLIFIILNSHALI